MEAQRTVHTRAEIESQPDCWSRAIEEARAGLPGLPVAGERVAAVGCGTSWFVAQAYAALREEAGAGETDAFTATAYPTGRRYDRVLLISRSGTTTEILDLAAALRDAAVVTTSFTGPADTPLRALTSDTLAFAYADERSVVQTRFPTTVLAALRTALGDPPEVADARAAVAGGAPAELVDRPQYTFLGTGWQYGLAQEAALKMREAAGAWTEAYPAMEYRHGPIAIAAPGRVVWALGPLPDGLTEPITGSGATLRVAERDPLAELIAVQLVAVATAQARGLDPDAPRRLTRSVILR